MIADMQPSFPKFSGIYINKVPTRDTKLSMSIYEGDYTLDCGALSNPSQVFIANDNLVIKEKNGTKDSYRTETAPYIKAQVKRIVETFTATQKPLLIERGQQGVSPTEKSRLLQEAELSLKNELEANQTLLHELIYQQNKLQTAYIGPAKPKSTINPNPFEWKLVINSGDSPPPLSDALATSPGPGAPKLRARQVNDR